MKKIAILGAGNIATALSVILAKHKKPINLYCIEPQVEDDINLKHRNEKYLPGISLPKNIKAFAKIQAALKDTDVVIIAVPSDVVLDVISMSLPHLNDETIIGFITKGLDSKTNQPIILSAQKLLPKKLKNNLCAIGGPAVASELATGTPAGLLIAGSSPETVKKLSRLFENSYLKISISNDLLGVGYAMALKNIYAILIGLCDGLNYPMNTKSLIIWLAITELSAILKAVGAKSETATSLAGLGDLLVTSLSTHGRNRTYGERLIGAKNKDPKTLGLNTVEGLKALPVGLKLTRDLKINAPLIETLDKCLSSKTAFEKPFINYLKNLRLS